MRELAPQWVETLVYLDRDALPPTLEHGDLHPHNIHIADEHPLFFDWSLSAQTHPFFSLAYFLDYLKTGKIDNAPALDLLRDAYLETWTTYAPRRDLLAALEHTHRLLPLYWALNYQQIILPKMEKRDRWLREKGLPFLLRQLLERWNY